MSEQPTSKTCNRCGKEKPIAAFPKNRRLADGRHYWCKVCLRVSMAQHRRTKKYRATITAYLSKDDVQQRRREADRRRREARRERLRRYRSTARARILHCRRQAKVRLKKAIDPARRESLLQLIAQYNKELTRMKVTA